jgi:Tfp pilus assembly protein PilX
MKNCIVQARHQQGMALPIVMALFMVSSVMLLAGWRNITLAHGWSRYQMEHWQLKQASLNALTATAEAIADNSIKANAKSGGDVNKNNATTPTPTRMPTTTMVTPTSAPK